MFRLVTSNTVEEGILEIARRKLALDGQIIQAGKFDGVTSGEDRELLLVSHLRYCRWNGLDLTILSSCSATNDGME